MKVFAIGSLKPLTQQQMQHYMPLEVPDTLQLYLDGKVDQFWFKEGDTAGTILLMDVDSVDEARSLVGRLPLTRDDLLTFDLIPVGTLSPLGMLLPAAAN